MRTAPPEAARPDRVAYVMNGFPRLSETFIAHEIHQLERLGQPLRLFSVKRENEPMVHPVVSAIRAPLTYLPKASSLSGTTLLPWLRENAPAFWPAHARLLRRRPLVWLRTAGTALALAWRHRARGGTTGGAGGASGASGTSTNAAEGGTRAGANVPDATDAAPFALRKVFIKEFLQAGHIADAVLAEGDIGHLHGHFCHGVATITWFASRLTGIPFSFTAHAKDIYQAELNPGRLLERKLGAARFVATCTCANAEVLRARHAHPAQVHTIYHGLDTDWFSPAGAAAAAQAGDAHTAAPPVLLSVGRFVEKKGFDHLVGACALLRDRGVRFVCTIVGERGEAYEPVSHLVRARGLEAHVKLVGPMAQDRLREVYRAAHAFALPCQVMADGDRDGFPNVLAEAMAMGVPVVSTRISGIPEMIDDGVHGLLVPPRDVAALADALERVLTDAALHRQLAVAARERICERFDSRRTTVALRDLFAHQLRRAPLAAAGVPRLEATR